MCKFLNRQLLVEEIIRIISCAQNEIIIVSPYINLSEEVYTALLNADEDGVEITLVYREEKLNKCERDKLLTLKNLNLLSHPEIHSKCYLNESEMIISSMNLYNYSGKYNREMGILIEKDRCFGDDPYQDAKEEVIEIIKSATLERKSLKSMAVGFNLEMLKPYYFKLLEPCKLINKFSGNKLYEVDTEYTEGEIRCFGFCDGMNLSIDLDFDEEDLRNKKFDIRRISVEFTWNDEIVKQVYRIFKPIKADKRFPNFNIYWSRFENDLTIYKDAESQPKWKDLTIEQTIQKFVEASEVVTTYLRKIERTLR